MSDTVSSARELESLQIGLQPLTIRNVVEAAAGRMHIAIDPDPAILERVEQSSRIVQNAVANHELIYGVTTGYGSQANQVVPPGLASLSQNNLLSFLATAAGAPIDRRHVRAAMLLRANMLLQGYSGIRFELIERMIHFLEIDATPVVKELGSIGASGDLVPLATIARSITGQTDYCEIELDGEIVNSQTVLERLGLEPIDLQPKEGLAIVNGTSFSAAIAANVCGEVRPLLSLSLAINAIMLRALNVYLEPFDSLVHACKPHPGQVWVAEQLRELLSAEDQTGQTYEHVQDRYSLRCLPQYWGPSIEAFARIADSVETEMNAISDNPLIDPENGRCVQSGNFLGQYVAQAMDDMRAHLGMIAKHLDVQIAQLVAPEFNHGLEASLKGNDELVYNMGLKGLQITGNSIMPMLTFLGNPLSPHYPTHAEQFNQNINGLSWGSAQFAWKSVELFQEYTSIALIFAVQAIDLRAKETLGHCDGRELLSPQLKTLYEAIYETVDCVPGTDRPLVFNDADQWLEQYLSKLTDDIRQHGLLVESVADITSALDDFRSHEA